MKSKLTIFAIALSAVMIAGFSVLSAQAQTEEDEEHAESEENTYVVRDSATILLGFKRIPAGDYIHLYDTTPYHIMNGHVAAKLPCDDNSETSLNILIGAAPHLVPAELELVSELSVPGQDCLYHADLNSDEEMVTDVAIQNPTDKSIRLSSTSTVVIGINEIMPSAGSHDDH
jgi:hypothetical protein